MNKYRYRKVTPEVLEKIKKLREKGLSYKDIGKAVGISYNSAIYHLSEKENKRKNKATKKWNDAHPEVIKEKNSKRYPYTKKYLKERYNNDEEFRKNYIGMVTKSHKKLSKEWKKQGLCRRCGREREDKRFVQCEHCRETKRNYMRRKRKNETKI